MATIEQVKRLRMCDRACCTRRAARDTDKTALARMIFAKVNSALGRGGPVDATAIDLCLPCAKSIESSAVRIHGAEEVSK